MRGADLREKRRCGRELKTVEWLGVLCALGGADYSNRNVEALAREAAASGRFAVAADRLAATRDRLLTALAGACKPSVVNGCAFARREFVELDGDFYLAEAEPFGAAALMRAEPQKGLIARADALSNGEVEVRFGAYGEIRAFALGDKTVECDSKALFSGRRRLKPSDIRCLTTPVCAVRECVYRGRGFAAAERVALYAGSRGAEVTLVVRGAGAQADFALTDGSVSAREIGFTDAGLLDGGASGIAVFCADEPLSVGEDKLRIEPRAGNTRFCVYPLFCALAQSDWAAQAVRWGEPPLYCEFLPELREIFRVGGDEIDIPSVRLSADGGEIALTMREIYGESASARLSAGFRSKGAFAEDAQGRAMLHDAQIRLEPGEQKTLFFVL